MENSIIQELNAAADRIILLFFSVVVICFLIFTNHASFRDKICSWNILSAFRESGGGLRPWTPCRGFAPSPYRGCAPDPRPSLHLYSLPRPAHHPHANNN